MMVMILNVYLAHATIRFAPLLYEILTYIRIAMAMILVATRMLSDTV